MNQWRFVIRVLLKAGLLFLLANSVYAAANPLPTINRLSVYNTLVPGRARFPYSENPPESYNITLLQLEGLFAAHEIQDAPDDEYRVIMLGDSAVWGWLLEPDQTLSACINQQGLKTENGQAIRLYNLGYPVLNVMKDLLILDKALDFQPDMVVWMTTLASLYPQDQLYHEIVRAQPERASTLIETYQLALDPDLLPGEKSWIDRTLVGQRRELADWLRHQIYGIAWAVTGVDHRNPKFFAPRQENLYGGQVLFDGRAQTWFDQPHEWQPSELALDVIQAGVEMSAASGANVLLINEPVFRSSGVESDLRYNFYYPRWAYDGYRDLMANIALENDWNYVDLWDAAPSDQFTDSSLHLTPPATCELAQKVGAEIQNHAN